MNFIAQALHFYPFCTNDIEIVKWVCYPAHPFNQENETVIFPHDANLYGFTGPLDALMMLMGQRFNRPVV